jgi:regulator of protease activity HflC (stomatin/prohibitin superfamily)
MARKEGDRNLQKLVLGVIGVAGLFVFLTLFGSFYTIDQGERGVITRNGAVIGSADPGLHFKLPFVDAVHEISVQTAAVAFENEPVYSADRQSASVTFSINYSALPGEVKTIYARYGSLESLESRELSRQARQQIKNVFGQFTAETAIRERGRLNAEVYDALANLGDGLIKVEGLQIENIDFSDAVETAAEDRAKAEMNVQTKKQELEKTKVEAQITVTEAKARADSEVAAATARAEAKRMEGDAEAAAIRAKGDALRENPGLVQLIQAERWDGVLPTTMVPGSTVPFMNMAATN